MLTLPPSTFSTSRIALFVLLLVASLYGYHTSNNIAILLASAVALPLLLLSRNTLFIAAAYAYEVYIATLVSNPFLIALLGIALVYATLLYLFSGRGEYKIKKLLFIALAFTPMYILSIGSLIMAGILVASLLIIYAGVYHSLATTNISTPRSAYSVYLGSSLGIPINISSKKPLYYEIYINESLFSNGYTDQKEPLVVLKPEIAGVHRYAVSIILGDVHGIARYQCKPFEIKVKAVPRSQDVIRKAHLYIHTYREHISVPIILKGQLQVVKAAYPTQLTQAQILEQPSVLREGAETVPELVAVGRRADIVGKGGVEGGYGRDSLGIGPGSGVSSSGVVGGLEDRGVAGSGSGPGKAYLHGSVETYRLVYEWVIPTRIIEKLESSAQPLLGDYSGARDYHPGDHPRAIHWKKSVSKRKLIVKQFTKSGESSGGGRAIVLIADWVASNPVELDSLVYTTYSILLNSLSAQVVLLLKTPQGSTYFIKGKGLDVLAALQAIFEEEDISALFNYESWARKYLAELIEKAGTNRVFREVVEYYNRLALVLLDELEKRGVPRNAGFAIVHPRAYALKYTIIASAMARRGYSALPLIHSQA